MRIYKSAINNFISMAEKYYRNGGTLSEMKDTLESNIASHQSWLDIGRAKIGKSNTRIAKSNILKANRLLAVIEALNDGEHLEGIGGQPIAGLACVWNVDVSEIAKIREFLTKAA